jgi:hypothetical protein
MFPIYDKLGGPEGVLKIIARRTGRHMNPLSLKNWDTSGKIPGHKATILIAEAEARGIKVKMTRATLKERSLSFLSQRRHALMN